MRSCGELRRETTIKVVSLARRPGLRLMCRHGRPFPGLDRKPPRRPLPRPARRRADALLGLLAIVLAFQGSERATPAGLAALTGRSAAVIRRDLRTLAALDLVERTRPPGARSARLRVKENARTNRLAAALARGLGLEPA
jgi:hypothetical protein